MLAFDLLSEGKLIEAIVPRSAREHFGGPIDREDAALIRDHVVRVEIKSDRLMIELTDATGVDTKRKRTNEKIEISWQKAPSSRRCEILVPVSAAAHQVRPIPSENRALLVASIARGRRWLYELASAPDITVEAMAAREGCSARKVNMTISLAFLAPDLVKAAIEGRLPHRMGVARLCELPAEWSRQHHILGLDTP